MSDCEHEDAVHIKTKWFNRLKFEGFSLENRDAKRRLKRCKKCGEYFTEIIEPRARYHKQHIFPDDEKTQMISEKVKKNE